MTQKDNKGYLANIITVFRILYIIALIKVINDYFSSKRKANVR